MASIGELGEQFVSEWLQSQGYLVRYSRWRCRWGEIDLIVEYKLTNTLVFVEVKTRSKSNWDAGGLEAISVTKQKKIYHTAELFLAKYPHLADFFCRFDVASVTYQQNEDGVKFSIKDYLENAFEISD